VSGPFDFGFRILDFGLKNIGQRTWAKGSNIQVGHLGTEGLRDSGIKRY
jgi:hypothetical protein